MTVRENDADVISFDGKKKEFNTLMSVHEYSSFDEAVKSILEGYTRTLKFLGAKYQHLAPQFKEYGGDYYAIGYVNQQATYSWKVEELNKPEPKKKKFTLADWIQ